MRLLTLHELVTMTLNNNDKYFAVDRDNRACSFPHMPVVDSTGQYWLPGPGGGTFTTLGTFDAKCDWMYTVCDATSITLRNVQ